MQALNPKRLFEDPTAAAQESIVIRGDALGKRLYGIPGRGAGGLDDEGDEESGAPESFQLDAMDDAVDDDEMESSGVYFAPGFRGCCFFATLLCTIITPSGRRGQFAEFARFR